MTLRLLPLTVLLALGAGCGVQVAGGARAAMRPRDSIGTLELSSRLHRARLSGPYGGLGLVLSPSASASPKSVTLSAGYRFVLAPFARTELGLDLALGEPAALAYDRVGFYVGATPALLLRLPLFGEQHDNMPGVAPFGYAVDLVLSGHGGRYSRALLDGGGGHTEVGATLGLRLTVFSDLVVASDDRWEGPWDAR